MATTTKPAAIYTRISLDLQDGAGVARQETECMDYARQHGLDVVRVYSDNSISAYSGAKRPGFEQLLTDVAKGQVGTVIVWATDRLYRKLTDLERIATAFDDVPVLAVKSGRVDLSTADGRMTARIMGSVAQHSSEKTAERVSAAARQRAKSGKVATASRPFGWTAKPDGDGLMPHPTEAPALRTAYSMLIAGHSLSAIARWLTDEGFTGTNGGRWTQARVSESLRMPRHGGMSAYHGQALPDVPNRDGGIVDAQVWWEAHRIMSDPKRLSRGPAVANLIGGDMARCHKCGSPVRAGSKDIGGQRVMTYTCKPAQHVYVPREQLDGYVTEQVIAYLTANRDMLRQAEQLERAATASAAGQEVVEELRQLRGDREGLSALLADRKLSLDAFTSASAALDARISALEAQVTPAVPKPSTAFLTARSVRKAWDAADLPTRRSVIAELIDHVEVFGAREPERFEIHWR